MALIPRWRIVWKHLVSGESGGGEPIFVSKEEALRFMTLTATPEERFGRVYDAELVFVDEETGRW